MRYSVVLAVLIALPRIAYGFDDPAQFFDQPMTPHVATLQASAEGLYFTGAPRFAGLTCVKCHTDGPQQVDIKIGADQPDLFTTGYQAGQTYELEIALRHESEGLDYSTTTCTEPPSKTQKYTYVQCNNNAFALEADTDSGPMSGKDVFCAAAPQGGACPAPDPANDEILVAPDGDAVFANRAHSTAAGQSQVVVRNDPTRWHLWWTAPQAGSGPVTLYVAAVDGNGGSGQADNDQDPYGDDTVDAQIFIPEAGNPAPPGVSAGCALSGRAAPSGALVLFGLALALVLFARRRPRSTG